MSKKITTIILVMCLAVVHISIAGAYEEKQMSYEEVVQNESYDFSDDYYVQWEMNFDSDWRYGLHGDCFDVGFFLWQKDVSAQSFGNQ